MNKLALQRAIFWCHLGNLAAAVVITMGFSPMVDKIAGAVVVFTSGAMLYMGRVLKTGDVTGGGDTTFTTKPASTDAQPQNNMKTPLIAILLALGLCFSAKAQTTNQITNLLPNTGWGNAIQIIGNTIETSTNWAVIGGYGHSATGIGRNIAFAEIGYNFNDYVGLAIGNDYLWGNGQQQYNSLKGGITLQIPMHPFGFLGSTSLTNIVCTPLVFDQIATSKSSTVANLLGGGVDFKLYAFANFWLHGGVLYENRTGDSVWGGNYYLGYFAVSRNF